MYLYIPVSRSSIHTVSKCVHMHTFGHAVKSTQISHLRPVDARCTYLAALDQTDPAFICPAVRRGAWSDVVREFWIGDCAHIVVARVSQPPRRLEEGEERAVRATHRATSSRTGANNNSA